MVPNIVHCSDKLGFLYAGHVETMLQARQFARDFISGMMAELGEVFGMPPCMGGSSTKWTCAVLSTLENLGKKHGYECYPWLLDAIWWDQSSQSMILGAECEWRASRAEEDDFQKLPVFKCPLKLFAFSRDSMSTESIKRQVEEYLQVFAQHIKGEQYVLVGFAPSGPRSFFFIVPSDGKQTEPVRFAD